MALRLSTALRNHILDGGSLKTALQGGEIEIYSGTQPTTGDGAVTGTLLCTITKASGAHTHEVLSTGTVTLTGGSSGSVNTVTVNSVNLIPQGAVNYNTSLTQTAADLAAAINAGQSSPEYKATSSGAVVTITAAKGTGAGPNTFVVTATLTTITASYANMSGGVSDVNGLTLGSAAAGTIAKTASELWTGVAVATGTAGWARYKSSIADSGAADASETYVRLDGSCATSGAQFNLTSTAFVTGATQTVSSFQVTMPAS